MTHLASTAEALVMLCNETYWLLTLVRIIALVNGI